MKNNLLPWRQQKCRYQKMWKVSRLPGSFVHNLYFIILDSGVIGHKVAYFWFFHRRLLVNNPPFSIKSSHRIIKYSSPLKITIQHNTLIHCFVLTLV